MAAALAIVSSGLFISSTSDFGRLDVASLDAAARFGGAFISSAVFVAAARERVTLFPGVAGIFDD